MQTIKLLFTSDEHGHIKKAPRLQNLIQKEKAENPNTLLVSSGDIFQGTPESDLLGGKPSLDVVKEAGYDLVELGNHDFDNGVDFVKDWLSKADYPVLAGNVVEESTGKRLPGAKPYQVFEMGGMKMGLIGVVTPETKTSARKEDVEGLKFLEPAPVVEQAKKELEEQGIDFIGVVSHLGLDGDEKLAKDVQGLDFILGGHTHQALQQPKKVGDTLVCQPGCFRDYLGSLEMNVDEKTGVIQSFDHELIPMQDGQDSPSRVADVVHQATQRLEEANSTVVTTTDISLLHSHQRESSLGFQTSEAMRKATGTRLALFNLKTQRADIPGGDVTAGQLYNALPFPNRVVKIKVTPEQLLKAIQLSEQRDDHTSLERHNVILNFSPPNLDTPESLSWPGEPGTIQDESIEIATTDFIAQGGLGYFKDAEVLETYGFMRDVLEDYLDDSVAAQNQQLRAPKFSAREVFASL